MREAQKSVREAERPSRGPRVKTRGGEEVPQDADLAAEGLDKDPRQN